MPYATQRSRRENRAEAGADAREDDPDPSSARRVIHRWSVSLWTSAHESEPRLQRWWQVALAELVELDELSTPLAILTTLPVVLAAPIELRLVLLTRPMLVVSAVQSMHFGCGERDRR